MRKPPSEVAGGYCLFPAILLILPGANRADALIFDDVSLGSWQSTDFPV
ncbi:hypothetical protein [Paracoccus ravus]|nr:hypothetical protein [Paracoccus ravus]